MKKEILSVFLLFLTALCWGSSFSLRKLVLQSITPLFFNGLRFLLAFAFLFVIYHIFQRADSSKHKKNEEMLPLKKQIAGAAYMGFFLAVGALFQQLALVSGTAGKTAFFSALYTIMVPLISAVFLKKTINANVWAGVVLAVAGIYLIGGTGNSSITVSDIFAILCALSFAVQILITGKFSPKSNGLFLSMVQIFVAGILNLILGIIFESGNSFEGVMGVFGLLLVVAFFTIALPYSFQIIAQKNVPPSVTAIVLSLESVFGAIFGVIILDERMTAIQITGCALIFAAIIMGQINIKKK